MLFQYDILYFHTNVNIYIVFHTEVKQMLSQFGMLYFHTEVNTVMWLQFDMLSLHTEI